MSESKTIKASPAGTWPYHEDPHGNMVKCANNPCSRHSDANGGTTDVIAHSPEEAAAMMYDRRAAATGMSSRKPAPASTAPASASFSSALSDDVRTAFGDDRVASMSAAIDALADDGRVPSQRLRNYASHLASILGPEDGRLSDEAVMSLGAYDYVLADGANGPREGIPDFRMPTRLSRYRAQNVRIPVVLDHGHEYMAPVELLSRFPQWSVRDAWALNQAMERKAPISVFSPDDVRMPDGSPVATAVAGTVRHDWGNPVLSSVEVHGYEAMWSRGSDHPDAAAGRRAAAERLAANLEKVNASGSVAEWLTPEDYADFGNYDAVLDSVGRDPKAARPTRDLLDTLDNPREVFDPTMDGLGPDGMPPMRKPAQTEPSPVQRTRRVLLTHIRATENVLRSGSNADAGSHGRPASVVGTLAAAGGRDLDAFMKASSPVAAAAVIRRLRRLEAGSGH